MYTENSTTTASMPITNTELIISRIHELHEQLKQDAPGYASLLHTIHRNLQEDPSTVHLLTPERVGIVVRGLTKRAGVVLTKEKLASKSKTKVGLGDL
jgi:hypothetical protein